MQKNSTGGLLRFFSIQQQNLPENNPLIRNGIGSVQLVVGFVKKLNPTPRLSLSSTESKLYPYTPSKVCR